MDNLYVSLVFFGISLGCLWYVCEKRFADLNKRMKKLEEVNAARGCVPTKVKVK